MDRVDDLSLAGYKTAQEISFLVIDVFDVLGAKKALFFLFHVWILSRTVNLQA